MQGRANLCFSDTLRTFTGLIMKIKMMLYYLHLDFII